MLRYVKDGIQAQVNDLIRLDGGRRIQGAGSSERPDMLTMTSVAAIHALLNSSKLGTGI